MALARKCDICGVFYEPYNEKRDSENPNTICFGNTDDTTDSWNDPMDCCPECMSSIKAHIESLKHK